jgi:hypothetical protein
VTHRADPVHVVGDGTFGKCSCGRPVQRVCRPMPRSAVDRSQAAQGRWLDDYRNWYWKHADARSLMVPAELRG